MATLIEKRKALSHCFDQSIKFATKIGSATCAENIKKIKANFEKKEIMVVTVGEMRRGKSSMLNALLGEQEPIFPVDTNVCTNVVTIVGYGEKETVEVLFGDIRSTQVKTITRAEIADYVSERGNPNNFKNVNVLNVRIPNPLLKEGIKFVDTPGVGSLNISHAETTYGFLPNADLLLFVSDSASGLTETELNFLKRSYTYCKNIVFPLTKKDLNPNYQEILEDNKIKISRTLEIPESEINLIPISNTAKMRALSSKNPAMLKNSNYEVFEEIIWSTIAQKRSEILFVPFIEEAKQELYKLADNVAAQYQLLSENKEKLADYAKELANEIEQLNNFRRANNRWRSEVSHKFELMHNDNSSAISRIKLNAHNILESRCNEHGVKVCDSKVYTAIYHEINDSISSGLLDIKESMMDGSLGIFSKMSQDLGLDTNSCVNALEKLQFKPNEKFEVEFPKRKTLDKVMAGGSKIARGSMSGGKIGSLIGIVAGVGLALLAGPAALAAELGISAVAATIGTTMGGSMIGSGVGAALGGAKGCVDAVTTSHDVDVVSVKKAFSLHIDDSLNAINRLLGESFINLKDAVVSEIEIKIGDKITELEENIAHSKENMSSSKPDPEKLSKLKAISSATLKLIADLEKQETDIVKAEEISPEEKSESGSDKPIYNFL